MKVPASAVAQLRSGWRAIAFVLAVSAAFVAIVAVVSVWEDVPASSLTRDPTAALEGSVYIGFLSQIGLLIWAGSAAVCLLGAKVLFGRSARHDVVQFLVVSGLFALYLGLDDAFRLHEDIFPKMGAPQEIVQLSYFGFLVFYLFRWRAVILETEYVILVLSLAFFGCSVLIDMYPPTSSLVVEDASKFVGLVAWLTYFFRTVAAELSQDASAPLAGTRPSSPHASA